MATHTGQNDQISNVTTSDVSGMTYKEQPDRTKHKQGFRTNLHHHCPARPG